jgi:hypothetical protein
MARRRSPSRALVLGVGAVAGLIIGLLVVATVGGERRPATYQPFFAGMKADRTSDIREGGPVLIPDPSGGERTFYLDLEGDEIVALHVIPPGGSARCPVQYDHAQRRYEDCDGGPVGRESLARFKVIDRVDDEEVAVFVDLREVVAPLTSRS